MGWNGSDGGGERRVRRTRTPARASPSATRFDRGIPTKWGVALLILVVGVAGVIGLLRYTCNDEGMARQDASPVKARRDVAPPKADAPAPEMVTNRRGQVVRKRRPETYRDERGVLRYKAGGARAPEKDEFKNPIKIATHSNHPQFKYSCENEIATLITLEPGDMLAGEPDYGERFKRDFLQALMEPIKINEDDSERDKEIKRLVEEEKHELAKRIKAGEDIGEIFAEARAEARRLAAIRRDIVNLANEMTADGEMTEQDMTDCYKAANKMLEEKGLAPMKYDGIMKRRMMLSTRKLNKTK